MYSPQSHSEDCLSVGFKLNLSTNDSVLRWQLTLGSGCERHSLASISRVSYEVVVVVVVEVLVVVVVVVVVVILMVGVAVWYGMDLWYGM